MIKDALESCFPYPIPVIGEVSNFRPHYSGHAYFTLKDEHAQLSAVMWKAKASALPFALKDGLKVKATGKITLYEKTGRYQMSVITLEPVGEGDLQAQFEALKRKLWEKGYFDDDKKQALPAYPKKVGLISSPTGAAIRDMISVAQRRNPGIELIVRPAKVQGEGAAAELLQALNELNAHGQVDVIVMGRGGGSLEDLWAFNDEALAQAIHESNIPVVSAVGHEIDFTIADFVADYRAPTPSAALELVVAPRSEMAGQLLYFQDKFHDFIQGQLRSAQQSLQRYESHHAFQAPEIQISAAKERLAQVSQRLAQAQSHLLEKKARELEHIQAHFEALSPRSVLERGYVLLEQEGQWVTHQSALKSGPSKLTFADGTQNIQLTLEGK